MYTHRLNDGAKKSFTVMNTRVTRQFCSSGTYQFHVIAINEHNAMSGESNIKTVNISANDDCLSELLTSMHTCTHRQASGSEKDNGV